ncbi:MAG: hypothetical protein RIR54_919 [Actinomycetota bacterium]
MPGAALVKRLVPPLAVLAAIIGLWYALAYSLDNNFASGDGSALIVPPPHQLFDGLNEPTVDRIWSALGVSLATATTGFLITIIVGVLLGIVMAWSRPLETALWPWLVALQVTPIIIVRVAGASFSARVFVTVLIAFFPVASNTLYGLRGVPRELHDLFTLSRASRLRRLLKLEIPAASPAILAGMRVSAGLAVIGAVVGDFFFTRGTPGLGRLVIFFFQDTRSGPMFVTSFVAVLVGLGFFLVVAGLRRLLVSPWDRS